MLIFLISKNVEKVGFIDEDRVEIIIKKAKIDKVLEFNKKILIVAYFCFINDFFSLFYSYYFLNASFVNKLYSASSTKIVNSPFKTLSYLYIVIKRVLGYLHFC